MSRYECPYATKRKQTGFTSNFLQIEAPVELHFLHLQTWDNITLKTSIGQNTGCPWVSQRQLEPGVPTFLGCATCLETSPTPPEIWRYHCIPAMFAPSKCQWHNRHMITTKSIYPLIGTYLTRIFFWISPITHRLGLFFLQHTRIPPQYPPRAG